MFALRSARGFEAFEFAADARNAFADKTTVDFELGLALAKTRADSAAHAMRGQMAPHAAQAWVEVLVLGKFHLEAAFLARCMEREDIQDECGAIDDLDGLANDFFEIGLLRRAELVIEYDDVRLQAFRCLRKLVCFSRPDKGAWVRGIEALRHGEHDFGTGSVRETFELCQRFFERPIGISSIDSDEYCAFRLFFSYDAEFLLCQKPALDLEAALETRDSGAS